MKRSQQSIDLVLRCKSEFLNFGVSGLLDLRIFGFGLMDLETIGFGISRKPEGAAARKAVNGLHLGKRGGWVLKPSHTNGESDTNKQSVVSEN